MEKKIFLKEPSRVQIFNEKFPGIPLPPGQIITRWGTCQNAFKYYAQIAEKLGEVVKELNDSDSISIKSVK